MRDVIQKNKINVALGNMVNGSRAIKAKAFRLDANFAFIVMFSLMPLVDSANGLLLRGGFGGAITVGDIYRLSVILLCGFFFLCRLNLGSVVAISASVGFGLVQVLIHGLAGFGAGVASDINLLVQWILSPLLVICIYTAINNGILKKESIQIALNYLQWLAPLTILIPYMIGAGYSTYGSSDGSYVGYKAFYYATNGISLVLIVLFTRAVYCLLKKKSALSLLMVVLNGMALALIGTKSSLLMLVLAFFVAIYCIYSNRILKLLFRLIPLIVIFLLVAFLFKDQIREFLAPILGRWDYFSTNVYANDLIGALTSGRVYQIELHWSELAGTPLSLLAFFVGMGDLSNQIRNCEMDYFDIFFQFGITGLLFLISFIVYVIAEGCRKGNKTNIDFYIVVFLLLYALIVGHVFNNAMSSMIFSLIAVHFMTRDFSSDFAKASI